MKQIKMLVKQIREEMCDAEKYAELAIKLKDEDEELSEMYYELSKQEIKHADLEHDQAVRLINDAKERGTETPPAMKAVWDWEHEQAIEHRKEVEVLLKMYK